MIEPARQEDRPLVAALLRAQGLPQDGLEGAQLWLERGERGLRGVVGLEEAGAVCLLRSLAVREGERGQGLGRRLSQRACREAKALGCRDIYLLTLTAQAFFSALGFTPLARTEAPGELAATAEFQGVCPASATLMRLPLEPPALFMRGAVPGDAAEIAAIYNEGIEERVATLETEPRSAEERRAWLAARGPRHPVLVALCGGEVAGWASLNVFNPREAYRWVADVSVYVARRRRRQGVARALLGGLVREARRLGYHKLVLTMFAHNGAARALYERSGFHEVGVYREQGRLDGRWVDTLVMERLLD